MSFSRYDKKKDSRRFLSSNEYAFHLKLIKNNMYQRPLEYIL